VLCVLYCIVVCLYFLNSHSSFVTDIFQFISNTLDRSVRHAWKCYSFGQFVMIHERSEVDKTQITILQQQFTKTSILQ